MVSLPRHIHVGYVCFLFPDIQIMATFVQRSSPSKTLSIETPSFETVGSAATSSFPHILQGTAPLVLEGTEQEGDEAGTSYTTTTTTITTTRNLIPEPEQVGEEHMFHQKVGSTYV